MLICIHFPQRWFGGFARVFNEGFCVLSKGKFLLPPVLPISFDSETRRSSSWSQGSGNSSRLFSASARLGNHQSATWGGKGDKFLFFFFFFSLYTFSKIVSSHLRRLVRHAHRARTLKNVTATSSIRNDKISLANDRSFGYARKLYQPALSDEATFCVSEKKSRTFSSAVNH